MSTPVMSVEGSLLKDPHKFSFTIKLNTYRGIIIINNCTYPVITPEESLTPNALAKVYPE